MALTRNFLRGMGITDEQVNAIIEAHADTVDGLKQERDNFKAKAEKNDTAAAELEKLKTEGGTWREKYDKEHADFEAYKAQAAAREATNTKANAYRSLLAGLNINEARINAIMKVTDIDALELDEGGAIKDADKMTESVKAEWAEFIPQAKAAGAATTTPPKNDGANKRTKADIYKIADGVERRKAWEEYLANESTE